MRLKILLEWSMRLLDALSTCWGDSAVFGFQASGGGIPGFTLVEVRLMAPIKDRIGLALRVYQLD
jgi:hypothetical protein